MWRSLSIIPRLKSVNLVNKTRFTSTTNSQRAEDETDVVVVGGGPAGLSCAIRLKQLQPDKRVIVVEKGGELGAHTLSGAVIETRALDELIPAWAEKGAPLKQPALEDHFYYLTSSLALPLPHPPQMNNQGNYIVSLSEVVKWLGGQAEELGVEVYSGIAASAVLDNGQGRVEGIITQDVGLGKNGQAKESFELGMAIRAKHTIIGEGCHGSLAKQLIERYQLRSGKEPQTYGLGIKEVWKVRPEVHRPGKVVHTMGWPLDWHTYGGSFLYHLQDELVSLGFVVGLDYANPYLNPYREFQRFKHHPLIEQVLNGGECISYGARAVTEGGYQSVPKLVFPGGALIGCSAGFLNVPKIKGTHTAMKSGMLCAEAISASLDRNEADLDEYQRLYDQSWISQELWEVRNIRPSFHRGLLGGVIWSGLDSLLLKGRVPFTFSHNGPDHSKLKPAKDCKRLEYPKPDGKISFDLLDNLARSGTNHEEDQPVHLKLRNPDVPVRRNLAIYDGPEGRFCPAGVYEYLPNEQGEMRLQINAQNCLHCKTCDIKDPSQNIDWATPEGGGGPQYVMT